MQLYTSCSARKGHRPEMLDPLDKGGKLVYYQLIMQNFTGREIRYRFYSFERVLESAPYLNFNPAWDLCKLHCGKLCLVPFFSRASPNYSCFIPRRIKDVRKNFLYMKACPRHKTEDGKHNSTGLDWGCVRLHQLYGYDLSWMFCIFSSYPSNTSIRCI